MDSEEKGVNPVESDDQMEPGTPPDGPYVPGSVRKERKPELLPRRPYRKRVKRGEQKVSVDGMQLDKAQMQEAMSRLAKKGQADSERSGILDAIGDNEDGARQKRVLKRIWERLDWLVGDLDLERIRSSNMAQKLRMFSMLVNGVATIKGKGLIDEDPEAIDGKSDAELEALAGFGPPKDVN